MTPSTIHSGPRRRGIMGVFGSGTLRQILTGFTLPVAVAVTATAGCAATTGTADTAAADIQAEYEAGYAEGRKYYPQSSRKAAASWCSSSASLRWANGGGTTSAAYARGCIDGATSGAVPRLGPDGDYPAEWSG